MTTKLSHTERRLNHQLEDWIVETVHADPLKPDAEHIAALKLRLAAKVDDVFRRKFPPIMGLS